MLTLLGACAGCACPKPVRTPCPDMQYADMSCRAWRRLVELTEQCRGSTVEAVRITVITVIEREFPGYSADIRVDDEGKAWPVLIHNIVVDNSAACRVGRLVRT